MIAVLKRGTTAEQTDHLIQWLKSMKLDVHISSGQEVTVLGLVGDTSRVDIELLNSLEIVDSVKRVSEPYKQVNRKFHPNDSVIQIDNVQIGGGQFAMIAGPCSVESENKSSRLQKLFRHPEQPSCVVEHSNHVPPPMPSKGSKKKDCVCLLKPKKPQDFLLLQK